MCDNRGMQFKDIRAGSRCIWRCWWVGALLATVVLAGGAHDLSDSARASDFRAFFADSFGAAHAGDSLIHFRAPDSVAGAPNAGTTIADSISGAPIAPIADPVAPAWEVSMPARPARGRPARHSVAPEVRPPWERPNRVRSSTAFEKFAGNPVLPLGNKGSLDAGHAEYPSVVRAGDLLWMFYSAYGTNRRWEIAAGVSPDGIRWTKVGVVLAPDTTAGAWDSKTIAFPCVFYSETAPSDERFRMWYAGKSGDLYEGIGFATSPDGRWWRREGRVLPTGAAGDWDAAQIADPAVVEVEGGYRMYYCGASKSDGLFSVGMALSADGRQWVKLDENPVYSVDDKGSIYTVDVVAEGEGYLLFASSPHGEREYEIHAVHSADGLTFDAAGRQLMLAPTRDHTWDHALVYGMDVVPLGENLYMWFNGIYIPDVTRGGQVGLARTTRSSLARLFGRP